MAASLAKDLDCRQRFFVFTTFGVEKILQLGWLAQAVERSRIVRIIVFVHIVTPTSIFAGAALDLRRKAETRW